MPDRRIARVLTAAGAFLLKKEIYPKRAADLLESGTAAQFLYLSTLGWKSGKKHDIEIWFVEDSSRYYVMSERMESSHWVQNIKHNSAVSFSVSGRMLHGKGRVVSADSEPALASRISKLMNQKYGWGDGMIVELAPE